MQSSTVMDQNVPRQVQVRAALIRVNLLKIPEADSAYKCCLKGKVLRFIHSLWKLTPSPSVPCFFFCPLCLFTLLPRLLNMETLSLLFTVLSLHTYWCLVHSRSANICSKSEFLLIQHFPTQISRVNFLKEEFCSHMNLRNSSCLFRYWRARMHITILKGLGSPTVKKAKKQNTKKPKNPHLFNSSVQSSFSQTSEWLYSLVTVGSVALWPQW